MKSSRSVSEFSNYPNYISESTMDVEFIEPLYNGGFPDVFIMKRFTRSRIYTLYQNIRLFKVI